MMPTSRFAFIRSSLLILLIVAVVPVPAHGHATGESYVWLNAESNHLEGRFEIRIDDLRTKFDLDIAKDEEGARRDIAATQSVMERYFKEHFEILIDGEPVPWEIVGTDVFAESGQHQFISYGQYFYRTGELTVPDRLDIRNTVLLDGEDPFHRTLLLVEYDRRNDKDFGEEFTALVFSAANSEQELDFTDIRGLLNPRDFVWQGVLHIWIGIDHVLFLLALLLTAVMTRRRDEDGNVPLNLSAWQPV
ncbi:MAG: DUF6702 family protein, partial [Acidobacteriota bacterium]